MKKLNLTLIFCVAFFAVSAQKNDTLVRNIQIERDYTPEVAPVSRPDISLGITEPNIDKPPVSFSKFSAPFDVTKGDFLPIPPEKLTVVEREKSKSGFLRLGFGPLFTWLADVWYPVWNTKDGYFDIGFHHDAILGVVKPTKKLINTGLAINFNKNFGSHQFYFGAKYDNEFFNYYGQDSTYSRLSKEELKVIDSVFRKQAFNKADFALGVRSNRRTDSGWLYDAYLNYHLHNVNTGKFSENNINAAVRADILFGDNHHIDVEVGEQTYFYTSPLWKTNVVIRLLPAYLLDTKKIHLRLGVKTFFNFGRGDVFAISPDVKLDYFYKDFLNLYAGVSGDYEVNSLANLTKENRYFDIFAVPIQNTWTPIDIFGGFKVKITKGLLLDAFLGYKYVRNEAFFVNEMIVVLQENPTIHNIFNPRFSVQQNSGGLFNAGIRVNYDYKERLNIFAELKYNAWSLKKDTLGNEMFAWHKPAFEVNAGSEFKIGKGFFGSVNLYVASKPKALKQTFQNSVSSIETISLPAKFDLNLGAGYNFKKNISFFAQANNILALFGANYQNWYGYNSFGAHLLVGATVLF
ncbi:MAG: hypothetical protein LBS50_03525 [Prevotellaceae bacterium]|jgi:hypothetical protein|nr:hypothetical protein [Prevotellaceae bacterium]